MAFTPLKLTAEILMGIHPDAVHGEGNPSGGQLVLSLSFASSLVALCASSECAQYHGIEP